jgi:hypothetical protein
MLQKNEYTSILSTGNFSLILRNTGTNKFSVTYSTRNESYTAECKPHSSLSPEFQSSSLPSLLTYLYNQMLPIHKECVLLSGKMQNTFGFISHHVKESTIGSKRIDDAFWADNATTISKLTDMFNSKLETSLRERVLMRRTSSNNANAADNANKANGAIATNVFSSSYAALQLKLAAIFCATALKDNCCMWHVSQGMMSDMSPQMQKSLHDAEPEKHYVTLLFKGDTVEERICRINLAVRFFSANHLFTSSMMPTAMALNASNCHTGVLVLTGVRNNIAAAIYHNSDTQAVQQNKLALAAYMGVL